MTRLSSAEGERKHLDARVEELDFEGSIDDRPASWHQVQVVGKELTATRPLIDAAAPGGACRRLVSQGRFNGSIRGVASGCDTSASPYRGTNRASCSRTGPGAMRSGYEVREMRGMLGRVGFHNGNLYVENHGRFDWREVEI